MTERVAKDHTTWFWNHNAHTWQAFVDTLLAYGDTFAKDEV